MTEINRSYSSVSINLVPFTPKLNEVHPPHCTGLRTPAPLDGEPPNVAAILADDLGYGDLGCYGATKMKTPNIDQLAEQGPRFTDAHSSSAVCTTSRYALIIGEHPFRENLTKPVLLKSGMGGTRLKTLLRKIRASSAQKQDSPK